MQGSAAVIGAGTDEIRQHIVGIGCANQPAYWQPQLFGQVARQNVAKIAGGHGEIHLVTHGNGLSVQKIPVGLEIIHDLRRQTADIDGVGAGKLKRQLLVPAGGEHILYPGLCIIKVTPDSTDGDIFALLAHHLPTLNLRNATIRIEHTNADTGHILEALQSGLAGIAGGGGEDQNILLHTLGRLGSGHQLRQHRKSHILKGRGGTPEQLQHRKITHGNSGGQLLGLKLAGVGSFHQFAHVGNIRQECRKNLMGHFCGSGCHTFLPIKSWDLLRQIQSAVRCKACQNSLSAVNNGRCASGRMILHNFLLVKKHLSLLTAQNRNFFPKIVGFFVGYMIYCFHTKSKCFLPENIWLRQREKLGGLYNENRSFRLRRCGKRIL